MDFTLTWQLALMVIVVGACAGFGWSFGCWLWAAIVGVVARRKG